MDNEGGLVIKDEEDIRTLYLSERKKREELEERVQSMEIVIKKLLDEKKNLILQLEDEDAIFSRDGIQSIVSIKNYLGITTTRYNILWKENPIAWLKLVWKVGVSEYEALYHKIRELLELDESNNATAINEPILKIREFISKYKYGDASVIRSPKFFDELAEFLAVVRDYVSITENSLRLYGHVLNLHWILGSANIHALDRVVYDAYGYHVIAGDVEQDKKIKEELKKHQEEKVVDEVITEVEEGAEESNEQQEVEEPSDEA